MSPSYSGQCMCGALKFSISGEPRFVAECVCESCRRAHGASVVGWVGVKAHQFCVDEGRSKLKWYESTSATERGFCSDCGTRLLFRSEKWPGEVHITLANIDPPHDLVSRKVSFAEELPAWTAMQPKP